MKKLILISALLATFGAAPVFADPTPDSTATSAGTVDSGSQQSGK